MTRADLRISHDTRGVVYVEFLFAFMPVFVMFLAICQLALLTTARIVVQHAALSSTRSAIVVLNEPPEGDFEGAPRGTLSQGTPASDQGIEAFLKAMNQGDIATPPSNGGGDQQGARMVPIRTAAYVPLLTLAPRSTAITSESGGAVVDGVRTGLTQDRAFAVEFTRAATVVTVHSGEGVAALAAEPIDATAPVTVRVTYFYHCAIPIVRTLMCRSLASLLGAPTPSSFAWAGNAETPSAERLHYSESPGALEQLARGSERFIPLTAEVTLPNQGAAYEEGDDG